MKLENLTSRKKTIGNQDAFVLLFGAGFFCCFVGLGFFWQGEVSNRLTVNSLKTTLQEYSREGKVGTYLVSILYYVVDDGAIIELLSSFNPKTFSIEVI